MSIPAAFVAVILIWSTTPLAIQWSGQGGGFLFGVTARMVAGALLCGLMMLALRVALPLHREALRTYAAAGLGIFGAMICVYWGAQFIPSGWISVLFGLTPMVTGGFALWWLQEDNFTPFKILGLVLGLLGLLVLFGSGAQLGPQALFGAAAVLASVMLHSLSAVWVKRVGANLSAMAVTGGGLLVAAPAYLVCWGLFDGRLPEALPLRTLGAIGYLAVFGSVLGFMLYYYLLRQVEAGKTALITLVTPVLALLLGSWLNAEPVGWHVWLGTGLILAGLGCHHLGGQAAARRQP